MFLLFVQEVLLEKPDVTGIRRTAKFTDFSIYIIVVLIIVRKLIVKLDLAHYKSAHCAYAILAYHMCTFSTSDRLAHVQRAETGECTHVKMGGFDGEQQRGDF